ncbi:hypothetical protein CNR22_18755 [Sphingobacteriaceae bacterium]|nr:hypothetical protein CNR22_18755 [Sphingobacteriaceae bacterium]
MMIGFYSSKLRPLLLLKGDTDQVQKMILIIFKLLLNTILFHLHETALNQLACRIDIDQFHL